MTGRDRIVAIALVAIAIVAGGWILVVSPKRKEADKINAQVSSAQSELSKAEGSLSSARNAQSQYASAYASVVNLGKAVPAEEEVPSLIYQLAQATGQRNVEFNSITSSATSASSGSSAAAATPAAGTTTAAATAAFTQMPFTFVFSGGFFNLEHLFREVTGFTNHGGAGALNVSGRLLTIQKVVLSPEPSQGNGKAPKLTSTITATAYVLPAGQGLTAGATPTAPGATPTPAATSGSSAPTAPAVVKVNP